MTLPSSFTAVSCMASERSSKAPPWNGFLHWTAGEVLKCYKYVYMAFLSLRSYNILSIQCFLFFILRMKTICASSGRC